MTVSTSGRVKPRSFKNLHLIDRDTFMIYYRHIAGKTLTDRANRRYFVLLTLARMRFLIPAR